MFSEFALMGSVLMIKIQKQREEKSKPSAVCLLKNEFIKLFI